MPQPGFRPLAHPLAERPACQRPGVRELALFHPAGELFRPANPFGKDVANAALFRALAWHGGFRRLHVLNQCDLLAERIAASSFPDSAPSAPQLSSALLTDAALARLPLIPLGVEVDAIAAQAADGFGVDDFAVDAFGADGP